MYVVVENSCSALVCLLTVNLVSSSFEFFVSDRKPFLLRPIKEVRVEGCKENVNFIKKCWSRYWRDVGVGEVVKLNPESEVIDYTRHVFQFFPAIAYINDYPHIN